MDIHHCRFGHWLQAEKHSGRGAQPAIQTIEALHCQVHVLGQALLALDAQGRNAEALTRLGELHVLRDGLLVQLALLVQESRRGGGLSNLS